MFRLIIITFAVPIIGEVELCTSNSNSYLGFGSFFGLNTSTDITIDKFSVFLAGSTTFDFSVYYKAESYENDITDPSVWILHWTASNIQINYPSKTLHSFNGMPSLYLPDPGVYGILLYANAAIFSYGLFENNNMDLNLKIESSYGIPSFASGPFEGSIAYNKQW